MSSTTDQEYHENPEFWGEAQFVTLSNIIDNILAVADDDSYFKNMKRHRLEIWGKLGLKKLNLNLQPKHKAISFDLAPTKIFPFPRYMKRWVRVSVLNKCGKLHELNINNRPEITEYFQDTDGQLFFDECDGSILTDNQYNASTGQCCYKFECKKDNDCGCKEETFSDSWVRANRDGNYFAFSDDLVGRKIVIEFICSGLDSINECDVKVHDDLELTIMNFIMYNSLKGKRNVPPNRWKEYYDSYIIEKNKSKDLLSDKITLNQIIESVSLRYSN